MARAMYRKAAWYRVATLCLAFVFVIGFTGIGSAVPAPSGDRGEKAESGDVSPPTAEDAKGKESAALDPVKEDKDPAGPALEESPAAEPVVVEPAAVEPLAMEPAVVEPLAIMPSVEDIPIIPAVSITPSQEAELNVDFEGRHSDGSWVDGNLGSYDEGEWVSYRMIITNKDSVDTYLPSFAVAYDYYRSQSDAIGLDKTKDWRFVPGDPVAGIVPWSPTNAITPSSDPDAGMPGTLPGDTDEKHVVEFDDSAVAGLVIPGDGAVVIYFEAHLSITAWWQQQATPHNGCSYYPGSSTHIALSGVGKQTLPWPVPPVPTGMVEGHKFLDREPLGQYSDGADPLEIGLPGWDFILSDGTPGFPIALGATSDANGDFQFGPLPAGDYNLTETMLAAPWATAYSFPMLVTIVAEGTTDVFVGNYPDANPAIEVEKSASAPKIVIGSTVTYEYTITNTGDVPLTNITAVDDKLDLSAIPIPDLGVGESFTFWVTATLTEDTTNEVTVSGEDEFGTTVTDTATAEVLVIDPKVSIVKTVDYEHILVGGAVMYSFEVTNDGDAPLMDIVVDDDQLGYIGTIASLAPGASSTLAKGTNLSVDTPNVATATALDEFENPYTDTDEAMVYVHDPSISIVKAADPIVVIPGQLVMYTYLVTNTGDMDLTGVTVTDDKIPGIIGSTPLLLANGGSETFTAFANISEATTNIGTVVGNYAVAGTPFAGQVSATSPATVRVVNPAIEIVKTASDPKIITGDAVSYTYMVTNVGDVPLGNILAVDDMLDITGESIPDLAVGGSFSFTVPTTLTETTTNTVDVTGYDAQGHPVTDSDQATVEVIDPSVSIVKTVDHEHILVGGSVLYTYVVTNTGDAPLMNIVVDDDQLGQVGIAANLGVSESTTFTAPADLLEDTFNIAVVTAIDEFENPYTDTDEAMVYVHDPAVSIVKTANPTVILAGETVQYTYVVTNDGDYPLDTLVVTDDILGAVGTIPLLAPGASDTLLLSAPVSEDTTNVATVQAHYGWIDEAADMAVDGWLEADDDAFVDVINPEITLVKSSDVPVGDFIPQGLDTDVTYTYVVTNTGDVPLFGTTLTDDKLGDIADIGSLAVGESVTIEVIAILTPDILAVNGAITNVATVEAIDEYQHPVSDEDTHTILTEPPLLFTPPDMMLVKTADKTVADPGDIITYTLTWTNVGEGASQGFTIIDDFDDTYLTVVNAGGGTVSGDTITWELGPAAPGATGSVTYTLQVASTMPVGTTNLDNVAIVIEPTDENPENDRDTWRVTVAERYLPFTGGQLGLLLLTGFGLGLLGIMFRRLSILGRTA